MKLEYILRGKEVSRYIDDFAKLRLSYFREYPYFYDAKIALEKQYLQTFANSPHSLFAVLKEGQKVIGALSSLPFTEALADLQKPFLEKKLPIDSMVYLGELVFEKGHENEANQTWLYETFENRLRGDNRYTEIVVYEIVRPEEPAPKGYLPTEEFWKKMGFIKHPNIALQIGWKEVHKSQEVQHTMIPWIKHL